MWNKFLQCLVVFILSISVSVNLANSGEFKSKSEQCTDINIDQNLIIEACSWLLNRSGLSIDFLFTVLRHRGEAFTNTGQYEQAINDFDTILHKDPNNFRALYQRGNAWRKKADFQRAIQDYSASLNLRPNYIHALNNRGATWRLMGEFDRAIEDYDAALKIEPEFSEVLLNRGLIWSLKKEYDRAIGDYTAY